MREIWLAKSMAFILPIACYLLPLLGLLINNLNNK